MELQPLPRLVLGGALLASTQLLNLFSLYSGTEWLQKNAPAAFVVLENSAFNKALLISGFGMCAWGLYEVWKRKHDQRSVPPPEQREPQSVSGQGNIAVAGNKNTTTNNYYGLGGSKPAVRLVQRVLEAVSQSPIYVGREGSLFVMLHAEWPASLLQAVRNDLRFQHLSRGTWGIPQSADCEVPFEVSEDRIPNPCAITLKLGTTAATLSRDTATLEVKWDEPLSLQQFFVRPTTAGEHNVQVAVLVSGTDITSVVVQADADTPTIIPGTSVAGILNVRFDAIHEIKQEIKREKNRGYNRGFGPGR